MIILIFKLLKKALTLLLHALDQLESNIHYLIYQWLMLLQPTLIVDIILIFTQKQWMNIKKIIYELKNVKLKINKNEIYEYFFYKAYIY